MKHDAELMLHLSRHEIECIFHMKQGCRRFFTHSFWVLPGIRQPGHPQIIEWLRDAFKSRG